MKQPDNRREIDGALATLFMGGRPRVDRKLAREILLASPCFWNGESSVSWGWYLGIEGRGLTKIFGILVGN
jgi:hypothetical protein